jgi:RNA polymerase sigma factor (sigma-70 family)
MPPDLAQGLLGEFQERRADLRRFLVARTGVDADADDLLNDMWIKLNANTSGPVSNPKSYLFRMANNLVLDRIRELRRREQRDRAWSTEQHGQDAGSGTSETIDTAPNAEQAMIERDEAGRLAEAIGKLPPGAQRVLRMHKLDGLSHREVADRLGISKSAVEKHMAVAMSCLRRLLES